VGIGTNKSYIGGGRWNSEDKNVLNCFMVSTTLYLLTLYCVYIEAGIKRCICPSVLLICPVSRRAPKVAGRSNKF